LARHSLIEPDATESGWVVAAFPYGSGVEPELPAFTVKVAGYREPFEALRLTPYHRASTVPIGRYMSESLREGHEYRQKARMAHGRDELFDACEAFNEWALAINERVRRDAPLYYSDLPQTAPWAFQGKGKCLDYMDKRLRAHSEIAKRLQEEDGPSLVHVVK